MPVKRKFNKGAYHLNFNRDKDGVSKVEGEKNGRISQLQGQKNQGQGQTLQ